MDNSGSPGSWNLIKNGTFDTDSDWTKLCNFGEITITGGKAVFTSSVAGDGLLTEIAPCIAGRKYRVRFTLTGTSGGILASAGGGGTISVGATGTYEFESATLGGNVQFDTSALGFTGAIDDVSMIEIQDLSGYEPVFTGISGGTF
jgi:hypothetical protein